MVAAPAALVSASPLPLPVPAPAFGPVPGEEENRAGTVPVLRHESIEVDQMRQSLRCLLGHGGNKHAAVTVSDEDYRPALLTLKHAQHVLSMGVKVDRR